MTFTLSDEDIRRCREIALGANGLVMDIVRGVSTQTEIPISAILGDRKAKPIVQARWLICYLAHVQEGHGLEAIARVLKYKDHTGVHYGVVQELKRRGFQTVAEARAEKRTPDE
jgi:chromosomal replication initiation ATPase DnaA